MGADTPAGLRRVRLSVLIMLRRRITSRHSAQPLSKQSTMYTSVSCTGGACWTSGQGNRLSIGVTYKKAVNAVRCLTKRHNFFVWAVGDVLHCAREHGQFSHTPGTFPNFPRVNRPQRLYALIDYDLLYVPLYYFLGEQPRELHFSSQQPPELHLFSLEIADSGRLDSCGQASTQEYAENWSFDEAPTLMESRKPIL